MFQVDLKTRVPIFKQVSDNFKRQIYSGSFKKDERVPSIRDLAKTLGVNPNTVQKAYRELEEKGFFYTVQGQGSFISTPPDSLVKDEITRLYTALIKLIEELMLHGETPENIIEHIENSNKSQLGGQND